jgi:acetyl esterase/lipase
MKASKGDGCVSQLDQPSRAEPTWKNWLWRAVVVMALLSVSVTLLLVLGTLRDPTRSMHGMLSSALWTTFGPHFVVLSVVAVMLGIAGHWHGQGRLAALAIMVAIAAALGSSVITVRIVLAASAAGGSVNPVYGLWLRSMKATGPDETVVFTITDGQALHAAIYKPNRSNGTAPVLLYIHGGGFMTGSFVETDADLRWFADQGWLVISVEYRLWTRERATWNKAPEDVACAVAWVHSNAADYGGETRRLSLLGDSAGGNLAINLAYAAALGQVHSDCGPVPTPAAVVVQYPAVDPLSIYEHGYPVSGFEPRMLVSGYIGGDPYALPDRVRAVSSYTYLSDMAPPTLILAPENDGLVPSWSVFRFADQARFAGVDVELVRVPFASHVYNQIASNSIGNQARLSITRRYMLERGLGPQRSQ